MFLQSRNGHRIVGGDGIALLRLGPARVRNPGFQIHHILRPRIGIRPIHEIEELSDVSLIFRLLRGEIGLQIVIAVGQAEPALAEIEGVVLGIFQIYINAEIEQGPFEIRCVAPHQRGEFVARYRRAHLGEIRRNRFRAQFLRARLIQERLVEGAYLAFEIGGLVWRFRGRLLHHVVEPRFRAIRHQQPKADGRLIGRNRRVIEPRAVGEAEEIVTRLGGFVGARSIIAPRAILRFCGGVRHLRADRKRQHDRNCRDDPTTRSKLGMHV